MEIIHPFRFKNTHKNITVICHAQAVSKHFPFTFFAAQSTVQYTTKSCGEHYISSQKSRPDLYFVPRKVCFGDACVFLWLWQSAVGVCRSKCVYSWLSPRPQCSRSSWLTAEMLLLSQSVHTTLVPKAVLFVPPSPLWPSHSTVCLLLFGDIILHEK